MILSIHQPAYLPWLGYFDRIRSSDKFVFLDSTQFEKNSFINRNRIKTSQGETMLTIPVLTKDHFEKTIFELEVDETKKWKKKHVASIEQNYSKAEFFKERWPELKELILSSSSNLAELCFEQLSFWLRKLEIKTEIVRSSALQTESKKSELILELCQKLKAKTYLSGKLGADYLDEKSFNDAGIDVQYQNFKSKPYPQLHGSFMPNLGVVDFYLNAENLKDF